MKINDVKQDTVPTNNKHTHNKYISHNEHTRVHPFCPYENELILGRGGFRKIK